VVNFNQRGVAVDSLKYKISVESLMNLYVYLGDSMYKPLIEHTVTTANAFTCLTEHFQLQYEPWRIYFTGLFHDLTLLMIALTDDYEHATQFLQKEPDVNSFILEFDNRNKHAFLGSLFLKNLNFPDDYQKMLIYHHTPFDTINETNPQLLKAINCLQISDFLSRKMMATKKDSVPKPDLNESVDQFKKEGFVTEAVRQAVLKCDHEVFTDMTFNYQYPEIMMTLEQAIELVKGITFLLDFRSRYTRNHSTVVSKVASKIALEMMGGLDSQVVELAGLLHDLGKLRTPLSILHKKGKLDDDEWKRMQQHVIDTFQILQNSGLYFLARITGSHHERIDGTGYPQGLMKQDLFVYSRILQVSDVYSALIENRPYREKLLPKQALQIIRKEIKRDRLDARVFIILKKLIEEDDPVIHCNYYDCLQEFLGIPYEKD